MNETIGELFVKATREKWRFPSIKGSLSLEDLWDLPLTSRNGASLNEVAKADARFIRDNADEEDFVTTQTTGISDRVKVSRGRLEIVKHIIGVRQAEASAAANAAANAEKRRKIAEILAEKQDSALKGLSEEELREQLKMLGG